MATLTPTAQAVDNSKFKQCSDVSFCRRARDVPVEQQHRFEVLQGTLKLHDGKVVAEMRDNAFVDVHPDHVLTLEVRSLASGMIRMRVTEKNPFPGKKRYEVQDVLLDNIEYTSITDLTKRDENTYSFTFGGAGANKPSEARIQLAPFRLDVYVDGSLAMSANGRGMMHFEHMTTKPLPPQPAANPAPAAAAEDVDPNAVAPAAEVVPETPAIPEGMWEERFQSHHDTKPHGPMSIGLDISFVGAAHVYGIPEHTTSLSLRNTKGEGINELPYRLYNLDVFEYELDKTMALYGAVPLMLAHDAKKTVALFWLNAAETFIDVSDSPNNKGKDSHWFSETGVMDLFFLTGPTPTDIFKQYATLTGTTALPQMFSIAYHQCRWNYKDENDVKQVDAGFDEHKIPYDVIWLDIEHTDGKRYFTWDKTHFPTPEKMQKMIADKQRKMVVIIDPHIKRDSNYYIHSEATSKGLYVKNKLGNDYEGWCWPGSSSYLDFTNPLVRDWWASQFSFDKYIGSTPSLYVWNDMNEPSVFDGPEVSMHKDAIHNNGVEHRDLHNLYGYYYHMATAQGLVERSPNKNDRPFVLSRAFFAGSQRIGAIWTGDNAAQWSHLKAANPMLLSLGLAGITFSGADVGGFFGNPDGELMARWYQAGAFQPFFRGHAHLDARRREPWLFSEPYLSVMRTSIVKRYAFLPLWYTLFHENTISGKPVLRPLWVEFPRQESVFATEDEFMVGDSLLVHPITEQGQSSAHIVLPGDARQTWFDIDTDQRYYASAFDMHTPIEKIPVFQRGGTVVPKKERIRRATPQMKDDPYTLRIALSHDQKASGSLYMDDEHSFDYKRGVYAVRNFTFKDNTLTSTNGDTKGTYKPTNTIERIVIVGLDRAPSKIVIGDKTLTFEYDKTLGKLVIRKPDLPINSDWEIRL
eukprot:gene9816-11466_t